MLGATLIVLAGSLFGLFWRSEFFSKVICMKFFFDSLAVLALVTQKNSSVELRILALFLLIVGTAMTVVIFATGFVECKEHNLEKRGPP